MTGRTACRGAVLALGAVWWWAVLRLALTPGAGVLEGAVAAGGWGLSLLPVHCLPRGRAAGALEAGQWRAAWRGTGVGGAPVSGGVQAMVDGGSGAEACCVEASDVEPFDAGMPGIEAPAGASSRRRWYGGSGPS